jgi:hypothetical protein
MEGSYLLVKGIQGVAITFETRWQFLTKLDRLLGTAMTCKGVVSCQLYTSAQKM